MTTLPAGIIEAFTLTTGLVLLVFGVVLLVRLRRGGGLEFSLGQMIAVPRHRAVFLAGLVICLASLFAIGLAEGVGALVGLSSSVATDLRTALFGTGAAGMLVLMLNALRTHEPSLEAGWSLQETAGRLTIAATPRAADIKRGESRNVDPQSPGL